MRTMFYPTLAAAVLAFGAAADEEAERETADVVYEVLPLRLDTPSSAPEREYAPAPCAGCLDERAAVAVAEVYLYEAGLSYMGEPRAEIEKNFGWRGNAGLRWGFKRGEPHRFSRQVVIEYGGEPNVPRDAPPGEDLTWRVWYQVGWVSVDAIERYVERDVLPMEALAWPPQKIEYDFLIHARTGEVAKTKSESLVHASGSLVAREEAAKQAAKEYAVQWLLGDRAEVP